MINNFTKNGFEILTLKNKKFLTQIKTIIENSKIINIKDKKKFSLKCMSLQNKVYKKKLHLEILKENFKDIKKILKVKKLNDLAITTFVHFRGVQKNNSKTKKKFLGYHRETFYSDFDYTKHQINISLPLYNYSKKNSLRIIPRTHKIPDKKIITKKLSSEQSGVKRFSLDHRLGLPYNPKVIVKGIDTSKGERANLKTGQMIIFSAMLIHGNGSNLSKKPRFSIDFGLINKKYLKGKKNKEHSHISYEKNGKYWMPL